MRCEDDDAAPDVGESTAFLKGNWSVEKGHNAMQMQVGLGWVVWAIMNGVHKQDVVKVTTKDVIVRIRVRCRVESSGLGLGLRDILNK